MLQGDECPDVGRTRKAVSLVAWGLSQTAVPPDVTDYFGHYAEFRSILLPEPARSWRTFWRVPFSMCQHDGQPGKAMSGRIDPSITPSERLVPEREPVCRKRRYRGRIFSRKRKLTRPCRDGSKHDSHAGSCPGHDVPERLAGPIAWWVRPRMADPGEPGPSLCTGRI